MGQASLPDLQWQDNRHSIDSDREMLVSCVNNSWLESTLTYATDV